ncbi:MAG: glycosyltransferase family 4 protein [Nostoc sp.]|uniref:glycosyltransferase family 4 protein n=1 Tax=Nostoc sp. TaxID=1180 RepID=UPI002FFC6F7D
MKILLYSSVFFPSLGGIETISATLATNLTQLGHECTVITETPSNSHEQNIYKVIRQPTWKERLTLTRKFDIVHSNGASIALYPFAKFSNKPFIWTHNGYQVSCVDGLGWVDGEPTPMTPLASLAYHFRKKGLFSGLKESIKLGVRRYVANHVDLNIAATNWVAKRQLLQNQVVAYTPYPLNRFKDAKKINHNCKYDFIYVGRLVSEKGIPDLIQAFKLLITTPGFTDKRLAIVGSGNIQAKLEEMVKELKLELNVSFLGSKYGSELTDIISMAKIGIIPSAYEEPMGGVALELLAAGKNVIVSEFGGLAECVGNAGLKFKNGDANSLYECMKKILTDDALIKQQQEKALVQVELFDEVKLTKIYIEIYQHIIQKT